LIDLREVVEVHAQLLDQWSRVDGVTVVLGAGEVVSSWQAFVQRKLYGFMCVCVCVGYYVCGVVCVRVVGY